MWARSRQSAELMSAPPSPANEMAVNDPLPCTSLQAATPPSAVSSLSTCLRTILRPLIPPRSLISADQTPKALSAHVLNKLPYGPLNPASTEIVMESAVTPVVGPAAPVLAAAAPAVAAPPPLAVGAFAGAAAVPPPAT